MKIRKLLVLFLIPATLFFVSCENEIPEEFQIELSEYLYGADLDSILEQVDFFKINIYKIFEIQTDNGPSIDSEILFPDIILNKGDILKLDGLEPGLYQLNGQAWSISGDNVVYGIVGKSNKMVTVESFDCIVVDDDSPSVVKLVICPT
jgi:hypothetical protein